MSSGGGGGGEMRYASSSPGMNVYFGNIVCPSCEEMCEPNECRLPPLSQPVHSAAAGRIRQQMNVEDEDEDELASGEDDDDATDGYEDEDEQNIGGGGGGGFKRNSAATHGQSRSRANTFAWSAGSERKRHLSLNKQHEFCIRKLNEVANSYPLVGSSASSAITCTIDLLAFYTVFSSLAYINSLSS